MAKKVIKVDQFEEEELISGIDVAYDEDFSYSVCTVLTKEGKLIETAKACLITRFPYVSGYFALREAPAVKAVIKKTSGFDIAMVNGHGIAHPRGFGLASQVGVELDIPTIGVAKRLLMGKPDYTCSKELEYIPIIYNDQTVGAQLRNIEGGNLFVSVGHRISLESCIRFTRDMMGNGSLPEPLLMAHKESINFARK